MKKLLLILLCLPIIGFGQEWTFGTLEDDAGYSVQQTNDGWYIITGLKSIFDSSFNLEGDVFLVKTNGNGDSLWTKTYGGTENELGRSIQQTNDGGYIITGYTNSMGQTFGSDLKN